MLKPNSAGDDPGNCESSFAIKIRGDHKAFGGLVHRKPVGERAAGYRDAADEASAHAHPATGFYRRFDQKCGNEFCCGTG
jgi:hypothetical protein